MDLAPRILTINPGSTSTKLGVFAGREPERVSEIHHDREHLALFKSISEQEGYRYELIERFLEETGSAEKPLALDAVVGRGGILRPLEGGVYKVDSLVRTPISAGVEHGVATLRAGGTDTPPAGNFAVRVP